MDYTEYFRELSEPPYNFDAKLIVEQAIDSEIQKIRHRSHHGFYHEYVRSNGYPLPDKILSSAAYLERPKLENSLRALIHSKSSAIILGCEGSGKTTLIHRVFGKVAKEDDGLYIYVDVSDVDLSPEAEYHGTIYKKLLVAVNLSLTEAVQQGFLNWHAANSADVNVLTAPLLNLNTSKDIIEAFLCYLRTGIEKRVAYLILDNIDSLSLGAAKALFGVLSLADENTLAVCKALHLVDNANVRHILACRTSTFSHVTNYSQGLFVDFPYAVVQVDDDFWGRTRVLELLRTSVLGPAASDALLTDNSISVPLGPKKTITLPFSDYVRDIFSWVAGFEPVFDKTIKLFCGRSIRRAKLFGLKILGNPVIARLALLEKHHAVDITRSDKEYLKRRLQEALLEFSSTERSRALGLVGFPLNPFRVLVEDSDFRDNPMLGVLGISYIRENFQALSRGAIYFAHVVDGKMVCDYLQRVGYTGVAIKDFFCACRDCGLLRPIFSSRKVECDPVEHRHIYELYVVDEYALSSYYDLIYCRRPKSSMIFYNSAVRAHYSVDLSYRTGDILYEAFTTLIFLRDIMQREEQLRTLIAGTGVLFQPLSSRIRSVIIPFLHSVVRDSRAERDGDAQLDRVVDHFLDEISLRIGKTRG